jgi:hypothetical protein
MTLRNWAKLSLALSIAALAAPAIQAGPLSVTEFQGNTAPNSISVVSFAPDTLTFMIGPPPTTTSVDPTTAAGANSVISEVNGSSIFNPIGPNVLAHVGDETGTFTVSIASYGAITTDGAGNMFQTVVFSGTSSDTFPFNQLNVQDGLGGTTYAELGLTYITGVIEDTATGGHSFVLDNSTQYLGQTGPSTTYDFSAFAAGGTGTYTLTNPSASAGSLISFVDSAASGTTGTYALLSNAFTETAAIGTPEPMTLTLLCTGVPLFVFVSRRRKGLAA